MREGGCHLCHRVLLLLGLHEVPPQVRYLPRVLRGLGVEPPLFGLSVRLELSPDDLGGGGDVM